MEFRKSRKEDLEQILKIIKQGQKFFSENNIPQWNNGYPNKDTILTDIEKGYSHVLVENNQVIGTVALIYGVEPTYNEIYSGDWITDSDFYVTLHRVAVLEDRKGEGIAPKIIQYVEKDAISKNVNSLRIDTHHLNSSMRKLIEKSGFSYCGIIHLNDGAERLAFEKVI